MTSKIPCAVLGPGNIGTDLMAKLQRSSVLELTAMVGIDPDSPGLARARAAGLDASADGIDFILDHVDQCQIVFDATSAGAHKANGPRMLDAGIRCLDLTPAKMGPGVVPVVNLDDHLTAPEVNLITCAGQATIPMVHAVTRVADVPYAEIVATVASVSAGPGTRQSIDEFTRTTAKGLAELGGAGKGKAIIILNPAEPPIIMRNTVYVGLPLEVDEDAIARSIEKYVAEVQAYVPGYRLRTEPVFDAGRVAIFVEVESAGDFLPSYAGNLDIMTAAAVRVGEEFARARLNEEVPA
jgi:acetaldehyde dehydrogenase